MTGGSHQPKIDRPSPGSVYPVREDSRLLGRFARPRPGDAVLEIGCGRGLAALESARRGARRVVATDRNPSALRMLRDRARHEELSVDVVRTDGASGLRRFDLVLCNPPYLPTAAADRDPDPWENLALDGGPDGCRVLSRVVASLPAHLAVRGRAFFLVSSRQSRSGVERVLRGWRRHGGRFAVVRREQWGRERLSVLRLTRATPRSARRSRGRGAHRPAPRRSRSGSSRGAGSDRRSARGAA